MAKQLASVVVAVLLLSALSVSPAAQQPPADPVGTFSILGYDPATGELGGAVQSRVFSVGNGVLWAEAKTGIVTTQAIVDVSYATQGAGTAPRRDPRR